MSGMFVLQKASIEDTSKIWSVKLVFSDSLKCALSHDIYHNLIFSRRHGENLTRKNTSKTG